MACLRCQGTTKLGKRCRLKSKCVKQPGILYCAYHDPDTAIAPRMPKKLKSRLRIKLAAPRTLERVKYDAPGRDHSEGTTAPASISLDLGTFKRLPRNKRYTSRLPAEYIVRPVSGDGSCMFASVVVAKLAASRKKVSRKELPDSVTRKAARHLRRQTVDYILEKYDTPMGIRPQTVTGRELIQNEFLSEGNDDGIRGPKSYRRVMYDPKTYASNAELVALSSLLKTRIVVHQRDYPTYVFAYGGGAERPALHLRFDRGGPHYDPYVPSRYVS